MALAKIKDNKLVGRDYIKYGYEGNDGDFPRIDRKWAKVPIAVCYDIEKNKREDFEVQYEFGDDTYEVFSKTAKADEDYIEKRLKAESFDLNNDGKFDEKDAAIAGKVLAKHKSRKKK